MVDKLTTQDIAAMASAGDEVVVATRDGTVLRCGVLERDTLVHGSTLEVRDISGLAIDGRGGYWSEHGPADRITWTPPGLRRCW